MCLSEKLIKSFANPEDLSKPFKRKHLAHMKEGDGVRCKVCKLTLENKMHYEVTLSAPMAL